MTEQIKSSFLRKVELQAQMNRLAKGDHDLPMEKWAMIAGEHMGHLFSAVMANDRDKVERELLHVTAPLLELYQEIMKGGSQIDKADQLDNKKCETCRYYAKNNSWGCWKWLDPVQARICRRNNFCNFEKATSG